MTFTAYSPRVARGGLTDDFSKFQATADKVRDDIKADALSRALKWQSLEERGKIRGAQPPQPSQPSILESALGAGASWLMNSENSPMDDWSSGLRGMFGNRGSTSSIVSDTAGYDTYLDELLQPRINAYNSVDTSKGFFSSDNIASWFGMGNK